ncbi:MAG: DUF4140 domain-containing protein [Planctomycetota bacterium]|nr:DUF4140 domain-containing protein [Planctomycetota bacterium]MDP7135039.1 DUF4140 domain-containing protein [Planctomycetota bacterium]MDP7254988.1 DUF4140 domain-containing protein [Planctomycetota bacterium]
MRIHLLTIPIVCLCSVHAEAPNGKPLDTKIDRILVYSNQAIVTRAGELTFQKANERVVVKVLPDGLVDSSVRVRLLGPAEPRLVNMEVV